MNFILKFVIFPKLVKIDIFNEKQKQLQLKVFRPILMQFLLSFFFFFFFPHFNILFRVKLTNKKNKKNEKSLGK